MAIISAQVAPNFSVGNYHRILKVEIICGPKETTPRYDIMVGFYAHAEARDSYSDPMFVHQVSIPFVDDVIDPRTYIYGLLMRTPLFVDKDAEPDLTPRVNLGPGESIVQPQTPLL